MTPDTEIPPELLKHLLEEEGVEKTLRIYTERYNAITARHNSQAEIWKSGFEAVIKFAELAIKSLLILCGGAAVAVLSFAGSRGLTAQVSLDAYASAVAFFGIAAGGAVFTAGLSYLAQSGINAPETTWEKLGNALRFLAISVWFVSLASFGYGVWHASEAVALSRWEKFEIKQ
ncbi:MAG: hypothetical protein ACKVP4_11950 [Hyphomicrobium sp.]